MRDFSKKIYKIAAKIPSLFSQVNVEVGSLLIVPIIADKPSAGQEGCRSEQVGDKLETVFS